MPNKLNRFTVPSILAAFVAAFAIAACGGSGDDDAVSALAKYMPADALVYVEGAVKPGEELSQDIDELAVKLTGSSLSDAISGLIDEAQKTGDVDFKADVEPWLGENAAMFVGGDANALAAGKVSPSEIGESALASVGDGDVGLVAESTDVDATQAFIDKAAAEENATDGEYESFSYKVSQSDDSAMGIVDDNLVFGSSEAVFKSMVDASKGDSLEGTKAFSDISGKAADGSLLNVFVANEPFLGASGGTGFDVTGLYQTLGYDPKDTGSLISLVPSDDEISVTGVTNMESGMESGDASGLIETFPANSLFATGSGDVGANITKVIDAVNEAGIDGLIKPGDLNKMIEEFSSNGLDIATLVESLETVGIFVSGDSVDNLGGALVATTSDPAPLKNALGAFSSLIGLADDAKVRPLGGGMTGFSVKTPDLPGRPVVVAVNDDRLVVAIGMPAARQALTGTGQALSSSQAYKDAVDSLDGETIDMFGDPSAIGGLIGTAGGQDAKGAADFLGKLSYMASGSGDQDKSFQFNLGVKD